MLKEESDRLLVLLDDSIRQSSHSRRELERRMGLGQGYLGSLFKGRIQLRVSHVYAISNALGIEPLELFIRASPPKDPEWLLEQLGISSGKKDPQLPLLTGEEPLPDRDEIQDIIRLAVRNELGGAGRLPGSYRAE
jgi:transcriptional regulator with XRE-family HTH domain